MVKNPKFKVEVYHPNSMRVMKRFYFSDKGKALKEFDTWKNSSWDVVTLFERQGSRWETLKYNS